MKRVIHVVPLGPGAPGLLTLQAADALKHARTLILRTSRHPVAAWLDEQGVAYKTFDALYDAHEDFDALHADMAKQLWELSAVSPVTYGVMDAATDGSVAALLTSKPEDAVLDRLPGLSVSDACAVQVPCADNVSGLRILPAIDCAAAMPDPTLPMMITEIDNAALAGDVKLWLCDLYDEETEVVFFPPSDKAQRKAVTIPLWELDHQKKLDHTACLYVPSSPLMRRQRFCFADLLAVMDILRGENGCSWDREQTHESLRKYLIEEAYEACGAIDEGDMDHLSDELGDVLLQVVFHASIGKSHSAFTISDVTTAICRKMIYRHPHIFGTADGDSPEAINANWEKLKKAEKGLTTQASVLADVSKGLPALMRADKVQKKAAQVGFDWDTPEDALPKVHEEADEVLAELKKKTDPGEELGDLLFSCVNVARLCRLEPENLLQSATEKFISRFTEMENLINCDGKSLEGLTLNEMDVYWNQVKSRQNNDRR